MKDRLPYRHLLFLCKFLLIGVMAAAMLYGYLVFTGPIGSKGPIGAAILGGVIVFLLVLLGEFSYPVAESIRFAELAEYEADPEVARESPDFEKLLRRYTRLYEWAQECEREAKKFSHTPSFVLDYWRYVVSLFGFIYGQLKLIANPNRIEVRAAKLREHIASYEASLATLKEELDELGKKSDADESPFFNPISPLTAVESAASIWLTCSAPQTGNRVAGFAAQFP